MPKHICAVMRHVHMYEHIDIRIYKHTQGTKCTYIWIIQKAISHYNTCNLIAILTCFIRMDEWT